MADVTEVGDGVVESSQIAVGGAQTVEEAENLEGRVGRQRRWYKGMDWLVRSPDDQQAAKPLISMMSRAMRPACPPELI
jgi:hypothetical protein